MRHCFHFQPPSHALVLLTWIVLTGCSLQATFAADRFVGPEGDDANDGSALESAWQTVTHALENLEPGDTLRVLPGKYDLETEGAKDGLAYVRSPGHKPLDGSAEAATMIKPDQPGTVEITGNLDVRGSHLTIQGLTIQGSPNNDAPGIALYECHHVNLVGNHIHNCGGGGISANHVDRIRILRNRIHHNAFRNPDQHSGISIYQPIAREDDEKRIWGIEIRQNFSWANENKRPGTGGYTDGNGIVIDDSMYRQAKHLKPHHQEWINNAPQYPRKILVEANLCGDNGGSGIHVFQSANVTIKNNTCIGNRRATYDHQDEYTNKGQISLSRTKKCQVFNNVLQSRLVQARGVGAVSPFAASDIEGEQNTWSTNLLHRTHPKYGALSNRPSTIEASAVLADPEFAHIEKGDYTAIAGKGKGVPWPFAFTDYLGAKVPAQTTVDLGAIQIPDATTEAP